MARDIKHISCRDCAIAIPASYATRHVDGIGLCPTCRPKRVAKRRVDRRPMTPRADRRFRHEETA
jgi:hypothetical protein